MCSVSDQDYSTLCPRRDLGHHPRGNEADFFGFSYDLLDHRVGPRLVTLTELADNIIFVDGLDVWEFWPFVRGPPEGLRTKGEV